MNRQGFTVIELLALSVLLIIVGSVFWTQKNNIEVATRDDKRKIAINSMYYSLEEAYYPKNSYYPKTLSASTLPSVDKDLFKDPNGVTLGSGESDYRYEGIDCNGDACKQYTLRANLQNEADYVKNSRRK